MNRKNGKIELLRFCFSMAVMIFHSYYFAADDVDTLFMRGALGVEFFFIVSGYLMACSVAKKAAAPSPDLGKESLRFIGHKISSLMPNFIVAWVLGLAVMFYRAGNYTLVAFLKRATEGLWELLFLVMAGFGKVRVNVDWYISAMLLAMLLLYPLCRKYFSMFCRVIAPLLAAFILGAFYYTSLTSTNVMYHYGWIYKGTLRAVAEICLGAALYPLIRWFMGLELTRLAKWLVTLVEGCIWLVVFLHMATYQNKTYDFLVLLLITVGVVLAFSHQGALAGAFDKGICNKLGEYSLSLYLGHSFWAHLLTTKCAGMEYTTVLCIYIPLALVSGLFVHLISKWLKKKGPAVGAFLKRKLLVSEEH